MFMIEEKSIQVNDLKVTYSDSFEPVTSEIENKTLLILPGWSENKDDWIVNIKTGFKSNRVIVLNLPAFGTSTEPKYAWDLTQYSDFLNTFIEELRLENTILVGKSFGGRVAVKYVTRYQSVIKGLVLANAAGIEKKSLPIKFKIFTAKLGKYLISWIGFVEKSTLRKYFYKLLNINPEKNPYKAEVKKIVTSEDLTDELSLINLPTLIIWGDKDKVLPLKQGEKLNKLIKGSELKIIKNAGHDAHITYAKEFNELVNNFLNRLSKPTV